MSNVAELYWRQNKQQDAEALLEKVLETRRRVLGPSHPNTVDAVASLGRMKLERGGYAEAEPLLRDSLDAYAKANAGTWRRYLTQNLLGASLAGQGKYEKAEPLLVSGWEGIKQRSETIPWEDHSAFERAGQRIVRFYQDRGKPEKVAEWRDELQQRIAAGPQKP